MRKTTKIVAILQGALAALTAGSLVLFAVLAATIGLQTPSGEVSSPADRAQARGDAVTVEGGVQEERSEPPGDQGETPSGGVTVATAPGTPPSGGASPPAPADEDTPAEADAVNLSLGINISPPVSPNTSTIASTPHPLNRVLERLGLSALFPNVGAGKPGLAWGTLRISKEHRAVIRLLKKRAKRHHHRADRQDAPGGSEGDGSQSPPHIGDGGSQDSKPDKDSRSKKAGESSNDRSDKEDRDAGSKKEKSKDPKDDDDDDDPTIGGSSSDKNSKKSKDDSDDDDDDHGRDDKDDD